MIKKAFYIPMLALLTVACTSIDCPVQNTVYTAYHIYDTDGNRISLGDMLSVTTTRRDGTDSVLLNRMTGNSEFELPISYNDPEDTLFFEISRMATTEEATEEVLVRHGVGGERQLSALRVGRLQRIVLPHHHSREMDTQHYRLHCHQQQISDL